MAPHVRLAQLCLLLVLLAVSHSRPRPSAASSIAQPLPVQQIASTVAGRPIAAGAYLFWFDRRDGGTIRGYHQPTSRPFVVHTLAHDSRPAYLTSDGSSLAWLERRPTDQRIMIYRLASGQRRSIVLPPTHTIADLALADGLLYAWHSAAGHRGIFAYDLASGREHLIQPLFSASSGRLAVADGTLLWSEYSSQGRYLPPRATLRARRLDHDDSERIIVAGGPWSGTFGSFDIAGDWVVWSLALEQQVWLLNLRTGARRLLARDAAARPTIDGDIVTWESWDALRRRSTIMVYHISTRQLTSISADSPAYLQAQPLADGRTLLLTADQRPSLRKTLYLAPLPASPAQLDISVAGSIDLAPSSVPPSGQVRVDGRSLVVDGAPERRWTANGVHLILPSRGINGSSFGAAALSDPHAADERQVWLDRAQQIGVATIRIYMDLPGDVRIAAPPRPEQIYQLARTELAPRGMRLALVIHNSGLFDDPDGQKMAWLDTLLDCFGGGSGARGGCDAAADQSNLTHLLAYINADNEINIHRQPLNDPIPGHPACRPDDPAQLQIDVDCFDHPNPERRQRYIQAALGWVALVRQTLRQHPTGQQVLLTVGMSVDLDKDALGDGQSAVLNYFVQVPGDDGQPLPALAELLDFIAPHSYTALLEWEIVEPIERSAPLFARPIVLEEFGYPTDPLAQPDPERPAEFKETSLDLRLGADGRPEIVANTDGLPPGEDIRKLCRYLPKLGTFGERPKRCQPSAPYVVQANLEAIFDLQHFAGGLAFMLADSGEKDDGSKRCQDADERQQLSKNLFLGLFAIDERYHCGGTVNTGEGQIKNTGYRVCVAYRTGNTQMGNYEHRVPACEIDLPPAAPVPTPTAPLSPSATPTATPTVAPPDPAAAAGELPLWSLGVVLALSFLVLGWIWRQRR